MSEPIRVLVVDDSAFARKVVSDVLQATAGIRVVGIARDGLDALEKIGELTPDVVTLDLVMPGLDGVGVLKAAKDLPRAPKFVVVSMAGEDSEIGVEALRLGAFDVVTKPTALANDKLYDLADDLRAKVLTAGGGSPPAPSVKATPRVRPPRSAGKTSLVVIGASTGGPRALTTLLRALPGDFPVPIAVVLHMPEGYTEAFAHRVNADSALDVVEARHGLELTAGRVVIARAGMHLTVVGIDNGTWRCALEMSPSHAHRPSVDVLFESAARMAKEGALGVVLTGMGNDGLEGAKAIDAAGGRLLTEAESSCVVYGMPRVIVDEGLSLAHAPIESMAALILQHL